jgi:hypothetical protein
MTKRANPRTLSFLLLALVALAPWPQLSAATDPARSGAGTIVPTEPIVLFNGEDLTNFYTWLVDHRFDDPNQVFRVVDQIDGAPAIRISGEDWGGLITKDAYANYHLVVEFRWGSITWGTRKNRTMDSGILLHAQGPEGNYRPDFNGPWMRSIEYQMIEGGTGDFIRVRGYDKDGRMSIPSLTATVRLELNGQYNWDPNGETITFEEGGQGGRINWYGRDPGWTDVLGFRGIQDVENPVGQWNRIEVICKGDSITSKLNGKVVNKGTRASLTSGKLLFQSEGAEVFFRRIELHPVR